MEGKKGGAVQYSGAGKYNAVRYGTEKGWCSAVQCSAVEGKGSAVRCIKEECVGRMAEIATHHVTALGLLEH